MEPASQAAAFIQAAPVVLAGGQWVTDQYDKGSHPTKRIEKLMAEIAPVVRLVEQRVDDIPQEEIDAFVSGVYSFFQQKRELEDAAKRNPFISWIRKRKACDALEQLGQEIIQTGHSLSTGASLISTCCRNQRHNAGREGGKCRTCFPPKAAPSESIELTHVKITWNDLLKAASSQPTPTSASAKGKFKIFNLKWGSRTKPSTFITSKPTSPSSPLNTGRLTVASTSTSLPASDSYPCSSRISGSSTSTGRPSFPASHSVPEDSKPNLPHTLALRANSEPAVDHEPAPSYSETTGNANVLNETSAFELGRGPVEVDGVDAIFASDSTSLFSVETQGEGDLPSNSSVSRARHTFYMAAESLGDSGEAWASWASLLSLQRYLGIRPL